MRNALQTRPGATGALTALIAFLSSAALPASVVEPGHSAAWYDPARSGEGWVLEILDEERATVYWFTYDDQGNQVWMLGIGEHVYGIIEFPTLQTTRGARFGANFAPEDVEIVDWGSMSMELGCDAGSVSYASELPAFGEGFSELEIGDERLDEPQAWFWTADGRFGMLGPVHSQDHNEQAPAAIDASGTMIVGTAPQFFSLADPPPRQVQSLVWTQSTGTTMLGNTTHLASTEIDWHAFNYKSRAIDISDSGDRILVTIYNGPDEAPTEVRSGILRLIPKQ